MLKSNLILYIYSQGRSRCFLYISNERRHTLWGSTVFIHCFFRCALLLLLLCLCVKLFFTLLTGFPFWCRKLF